jgi:hypothetical protein
MASARRIHCFRCNDAAASNPLSQGVITILPNADPCSSRAWALLNAETASMLADPAVKKALETATGGEVRASTPEEMRALIRSEIAKWSKVIDEAKIARIE